MTDPNMPPERVVVVDREPQTTVNVERERPGGSGGGGFLAFLIGGLVIVVAVIAFVVMSGNNPVKDAGDTNVDVNVDLPKIEAPELPKIEPPSLPTPSTPAPN